MIRLRWRGGPEPQADSVRGERGVPIVRGARSLQSRMSSVLAVGLMTAVAAGMLAWYYAEALSRPAVEHGKRATQVEGAPGEGMTLPPFGSAGEPATSRPAQPVSGAPPVRAVPALQPASVPAAPADSWLEPSPARSPGELRAGYGAPAPLSPRQQALERRLSGDVFAQAPHAALPDAAAAGPGGTTASADSGTAERTGAGASNGDDLRALLRPGVLAAAHAEMLPTQHLLLPQGAFIDCTLETAIDSTLPGMTTCITATDTFSADGTVVLLDRGTRLIGETRGEVRQGQARVFVVWTEARTPAGVVMQLDSPGTDALGRSGLEGRVNRHFWQRFGAAALVSTIDGAVQSRVQSSSRGGTLVLDPTASEDVLTGILRSTVNIPPTIRVGNGARIQVLVARDVDFRDVYELDAR